MAFFKKKKTDDTPPVVCDCGGACSPKPDAEQLQPVAQGDTNIKVLGSGCSKCNQLEAAVKAALKQLNLQTPIEHVTDFGRIAEYGVMTTPALVINEKVVSFGKVLKTDEVVKILKNI